MAENNIENEEKLLHMSYSKLDTFITCPYRYKLQYIDGNYSESSTLVLDLGTLLHKILELKYGGIIHNKLNNYQYLLNVLENGIKDNDDKKDKNKFINGLKRLKEIYGESEFTKINVKSGASYNDKMYLFRDKIQNEVIEDGWKPYKTEEPFEFNYKNRVIFTGFIDRIDINNDGDLRIIDYKSSNQVYKDDKLRTPLQMVIYALACYKKFKRYPIEFIYDFILLDETQEAGTKGFIDRGIKKIDKTLDEIEWCEGLGEYIPKPSPLDFWCPFTGSSDLAPWELAGLCAYYMNWTPNKKDFSKHQEYK